jgi:hypothetical protein
MPCCAVCLIPIESDATFVQSNIIEVKKLLFKKVMSLELSEDEAEMQSDLLHKQCFEMEIE